MKKQFTSVALISLFSASMTLGNSLSATVIEGNQVVQIGDTVVYSAGIDANVQSYYWMPPVGCRIIEGQGSAAVRIASTFLSQDGILKVERTFSDHSRDTLKTAVTFCRYVSRIEDHSINPGGSITVGGKEYSTADIYYEPVSAGNDACTQVVAHRLTVVPNSFAASTKPYLQTATSSSIWISWKTDAPVNPVVQYGKDAAHINLTKEGTSQKLSDTYYWNSVQLTGLDANTLYSYKVKPDYGESETYRFRTMPVEGEKKRMRVLLMGDHQIKTRSGYEWLMQAAKRKVEEKYGNMEENINLIMNVGDQVDVGTLEQYEQIHLFKSQLMSPYLPVMTAVGNHETYSDPGMANYAAHYHYEDLEYKGIRSGTENYYAYQAGRILFVVLDTEHTGDSQKNWVRSIVDAVKEDDRIDFVISVNHRPIQAEQYIGDISAWVRNDIIPILSETPKHVFNYGGHHHLYHRGQLTDYPLYHIINGAASWDQMWGMSSEKDYNDVQKTIDYWGYQILDFDFDKKEMKAECYAIGNKELVVDNILIDSFHRSFGKAIPSQPDIEDIPEILELPYTFKGSPYSTTSDEVLNTVQYQFSLSPDFITVEMNNIRDVENFYGSTGKPLHIPVDTEENEDITQLSIGKNKLKNGTYYVRVRYRDANMEWSQWSENKTFKVTGSIDGDPGISIGQKTFANGQDVTVFYQYAPEGQKAWIGIYRKGQEPNGGVVSVKWKYTDAQSGNVVFNLDETDEYYAVLFQDEGYTEISPRLPFYVGPLPQISIDKTVYEVGELVKVTFGNAPGLNNDWIGIYKMGKVPGTADLSDSWDYIAKGADSGEMNLGSGLQKGYYFINYFMKGKYFEPAERTFFSIGHEISEVSVEKNIFTKEDSIKVYYKNGPGTPKDWVGFFKEGKEVGTDELDAFYYTYGATEGYITVKPGELPQGDYFCSLYINDSYDEVSGRIHISIKDAGTGMVDMKTDVCVYPNPVTDVLTVDNTAGLYTGAEIRTLTGDHIKSASLCAGANILGMNELPAGVYLLRLTNGQMQTVRKIIKR